MVALTPSDDNFQTKCIIAIVAARPLENVKSTPSMIDIYFPRPEETEIDPQQQFVMIEARSGYYEGSRHTLKALQKLHQERFVDVVLIDKISFLTNVVRFPLAEHICNLKTDLPPPPYLEPSPFTNLSSAFDNVEQKRTAKKVDILHNWPSAPAQELDQSQWNALEQMLTSRLAIIQGPPGTGKTHVSVVGLRILLENKSSSDPPIIVAAQTNHALDQILRHISNFDDNYIRLGGRSKNTEVKKHTIYEVRKKENVRPPMGSIFGRAMKAQTHLGKAMAATLAPLTTDGAAHPLAPDMLRELGVITGKQAESLVAGANQWVSASPETPQDPMSLWLDKQLVPYQVVYEQNDFGYEEEEKDEEYEQLKELEAEHGVDDDEDGENLQGLFRIVEDRFTGRTMNASYKTQAETQLARYSDLWDIPQRHRGAVYRLFQDRAKAVILKRFREQAQRYAEISQDLQVGKWERDAVVLQKANVIGMTTTGFSKYRPLVASLKPKIVLIEEAAEVIEGPVTAVCVESLEHLILVGDHQQLQGHCNVQELEEVFHLNVSMFERLVSNKMPFKTLTRQRRMDPEIRRVLAPIYHDLEDHPSVIGRPPVPAMGDVRSFFFDHSWSEGSDTMLSKYNEQEAEFIVGFFCYLVQGGMIPPHGITVLTFYNGQRKLILKLLKQKAFLAGEYISVNTVDSYQGEENAVVLLSLVRSNEQGKIGFLEVANRVCVALSRARLGFYIFGNASQLAKNSLWSQVLGIMSTNPNRVGRRFPIECINHHRKAEIQYARDWEGRYGCNQRCTDLLDCGHRCPLTCHPFSHKLVICKAPCKRPLVCGHSCKKECCNECACKINCADFARLSENPDAVRGSELLVGSYNASTASEKNGLQLRNSDGSVPPMEVRSNNNTENHATVRSGQITPTLGAAGTAEVSSSSSAITETFGLLSPEKQLQSRANWGAFANGGAKHDDLFRDKGAMQQKQRLMEQDMDLLGLHDPLDNPRIGNGHVQNEVQRPLKNGRVRHDHDYVPADRKHRTDIREGHKPDKNGVEVEDLIDM